ncbi:hypothetical protein AHAS_Ahas10G0127200 [Arachis hypogaea]
MRLVLVNLPDGSTTTTNICGTVQLSKHLILTNVLFIPHFKYNLISVSKLTKSLHYNLFYSFQPRSRVTLCSRFVSP